MFADEPFGRVSAWRIALQSTSMALLLLIQAMLRAEQEAHRGQRREQPAAEGRARKV